MGFYFINFINFFEWNFSEPFDPFFFELITTHDYIACYLIFVIIVVTWLLCKILYAFFWGETIKFRGNFWRYFFNMTSFFFKIWSEYQITFWNYYAMVFVFFISTIIVCITYLSSRPFSFRPLDYFKLEIYRCTFPLMNLPLKPIYFSRKWDYILLNYLIGPAIVIKGYWNSRRFEDYIFERGGFKYPEADIWHYKKRWQSNRFMNAMSIKVIYDYNFYASWVFLRKRYGKNLIAKKKKEMLEKFVNVRRLAYFFKEADGIDKFYSLQRWRHSFRLELFWAFSPAAIIWTILGPSLVLLYSTAAIEYSDINIGLNAHQWYWNINSINGGFSSVHNVMVPVEMEDSSKFFNIFTSFYMENFWYTANFSVKDFKYFEDVVLSFNYYFNFDSYLMDIDDQFIKGLSPRLLDTTQHIMAPCYTAVKFSVSANDVLHSFALPSIGAKIDAVTGRINDMTTFLAKEGILRGQCSELCGAGHYGMPIVLEVLNVFDYFNAVEHAFWISALGNNLSYCPLSIRFNIYDCPFMQDFIDETI